MILYSAKMGPPPFFCGTLEIAGSGAIIFFIVKNKKREAIEIKIMRVMRDI